MQKIYTACKALLYLTIVLLISTQGNAQTTLATPDPTGTDPLVYYSDNAPGVIVFGVRNNNPYDIVITDIDSRLDAGWGGVYSLWYRTTGITGAPGAITTANGWIKAAPSNAVAPTTNAVQPVIKGLNIVIPANTTYRFALEAPIHGPVYAKANTQPDIVSGGGVDIYLQGNALSPNYAGPFPGAPTNTPRGFYGSITFSEYGACSPTANAGTAGAFPDTICQASPTQLYIADNHIATGQTYIWQSAPTSTGPWTNVSTSASSPYLTVSPSSTTFYRAEITCAAGTPQYSAPVEVVVRPGLAGGFYTINPAQAASATNFTSISSAINAMSCGISGPVTFNVEPGSIFSTPVTIPAITGASSNNRIRFLGNGSTIQVTPTTTDRHAIRLDGADYITIDSFNIVTIGNTYGWGIHLTNGADYDSIRGCTIDIMAVTSTTQSNSGGIIMSGSTSSVTTDGSGSHNLIVSNVIKGGYQGVIITGTTGATNATGNIIKNNIIQDFYANGIELADNDSAVVSDNDINRMNRSVGGSATTVVTTFAGIEMNGGTKRSIIEGNMIHDTHNAAGTDQADAAYGIYSTSNDAPVGEENKVINNLIYNFNSGTGTQYGIYNTGSNGVHYYHNTIVLDNGGSTSGLTRGFYQTTAATNIEFKNNIVYVNRQSGTSLQYALYFGTTTSSIVSDYNVLYAGPNADGVGYYSSGQTTLADWQLVNSNAYDQNSVSEDPIFTSPGFDFIPTNPAINNIAQPGLVATDITGAARSAFTDPGAYEFSVAGTDASLSWVSPAMPATMGSQTVTVAVTNNNNSGTINTINLSYTDGGSVFVTQQFTGLNIAATATQNLSFTTPYNVTGNVNLQAFINIVNGNSDINPLNDTASVSLCFQLNGDYTINPNLPTGGNNFADFTDAVAAMNCGGVSGPVTFNVEPGSFFSTSVTIPAITGASSNNRIRFLGNGATLQVTPTTTDRHAIRLDGADYITIDSFNIVTIGNTYGWGIHLTNGADYDSIRGCTIDIMAVTSTTQSNSGGIIMSGSTSSVTTDGSGSHNMIVSNVIKGGYQGVIITGTTGATNATGNIIKNNIIQDFYANGIELADNDSAVVSHNDINRMNRSVGGSATTVVTTFAGIEMNGGTKRSIIEGNMIHDTHNAAGTDQADAAYGIYSTSNDAPVGEENKVINNLIYNFNSGTGVQYGIYNTGSDGVHYYHNTIVLDNGGSTSGVTRGFYQTTAATNIEFKNNIVYVNRQSGTSLQYALYFGTTTSTIASDYNVLYAGPNADGVGYYSSGQATIAAWQQVNSNAYDQNSLSVDPMFTSPGFDFTPTNPAVNNKGDNLGVQVDITGRTRSTSSPDAGAYEFSLLVAGIDLVTEGLLSPVHSSNNCFIANESVSVRIRNNSTSAIDFTINPATVTINVTGATTQTLIETLNTGVLQPDSTLDVVFTTPLNMTAAGAYTFNGGVTVSGDVNTTNDTIPATLFTRTALTTGTVSVTPAEYCASSTADPVLSATGVAGYANLQWQSSNTSGSGFSNIPDGNTIPFTDTATVTQTRYYRLVATCGAETQTSTEVTVQFGDPMIIGTTDATRCGDGTVSLSATSNVGVVNWYTSATGGTAIATGNTFTTPVLSDTTTYYAAAAFGYSNSAVPGDGAWNHFTTTGSFQTSSITSAYMILTVLQPVTLSSVDIYPSATVGTTFGIEARTGSASGSAFASYLGVTTVTNSGTPSVAQTVPVNWTLPAGTYYIGFTSNPNTWRSGTATHTFPWVLPGYVSVDYYLTPSYQYYFYNLQITTGCESPRVPVKANVAAGPTFTVSSDTTICNNATQMLSVTSNTSNFDSYTWSPQTNLYTDAAATIPYSGGSATTVYVKRNTAGVYRYYATANNSSTLCGGVDSVDVTVMPVPVISATNNPVCNSGVATLSVSPATGYGSGSLQWQVSANGSAYSDINGATNSSYVTPAINQITYYKLVLKDAAGNICSEPTQTIVVNTPIISGVAGASRCGTGSVTLGATASAGASVNWYTSSTGGAPVHTGTSYTTPNLSSNTTYYAVAALGSTTQNVGRTSPASASNLSSSPRGLIFNANQSFTLNSVTVYSTAAAAGSGTIELRNSAGTTIAGPINVSWAGGGTAAAPIPFVLPLNITVPQGTDYRLFMTSVTGGGISYEFSNINTGTWSAYKTPGNEVEILSSITSFTGSPSYTTYYYFYDWQITTGCESATRTAVTATINQPGTAAGASGTIECATASISGTTTFIYTDCDPVAVITPNGALPMSGSVNACVTIDASVQTINGQPYVQRHYDITPATNASIATSNITLYFLQSEFNAYNAATSIYPALPTNSSDAAGIANLRITQYNGTGTAPGNYTGTPVVIDPVDADIVWNSTLNRWEVTFSATGSGGFYLHTGNFILPVTILNFRGDKAGAINKLSWTTATEKNNAGFEIQRSADGRSFSRIAYVASKSPDGNSNTSLSYSYDDARPLSGNNYYRLKQIDKDGQFNYSNVVLLKSKSAELMITSVFPNPAIEKLNVIMNSPTAEKVTLVITDLTGKVIVQQTTQLVVGDNQQQLSISALASGTYLLKAICANGCETSVHRFVKQ